MFAALFLVAGVGHFAATGLFLKIMPPYLPLHRELVLISGAIEIALGVMLLIPRTSRLAAWGLVALLIAVFPANIYVYQHRDMFPVVPRFGLAALAPPAVPGRADRLGVRLHPRVRAKVCRMTRRSRSTMIRPAFVMLAALLVPAGLGRRLRSSSRPRATRPGVVEGWTVLVNKTFLADEPELADRALTLLRFQLYQVARRLPDKAVESCEGSRSGSRRTSRTTPAWPTTPTPAGSRGTG